MITSIIFLIIGGLVGSFTLLGCALCIFFGIPETLRMKRRGFLVQPNPIIKNYLISAILLFLTWIIVVSLLNYFGNSNITTSFLWGSAIVMILSVGQFKRNQANVSDYVERNSQYLNNEFAEKILSTRE